MIAVFITIGCVSLASIGIRFVIKFVSRHSELARVY